MGFNYELTYGRKLIILTPSPKYCSFAFGSCLFGGCGWSGTLASGTSIVTAPLGMGYDVGIQTLPWVVQRMLGAMKSRSHTSSGMAVTESYNQQTSVVKRTWINFWDPLNPKSDQHLISP